MIRSFSHRGLEAFFITGSKAGIQPAHAKRLRLQLARLDAAVSAGDMGLPAWHLYPLKGDLEGCWSVRVDQNWRLIFRFEGKDAVEVDCVDYH